jgi:hypothetical protein
MLLSMKENRLVLLTICKRLFSTLYSVDIQTNRFAKIDGKRHNGLYSMVSLLIELNAVAMAASYLYRAAAVENIQNIVGFDVLMLIAVTVSTRRIPSGNGRNIDIVFLLNEVSNLPETGN